MIRVRVYGAGTHWLVKVKINTSRDTSMNSNKTERVNGSSSDDVIVNRYSASDSPEGGNTCSL